MAEEMCIVGRETGAGCTPERREQDVDWITDYMASIDPMQ
jgi:hypothetical protein